MTCDLRFDLVDYARGAVPEQAASGIALHLSVCGDCREELIQIQTVLALAAHEAAWSPPPAYWSTTLPRIHERLRGKSRFSVPGWLQQYAVPAAAAAALALFVLKIAPLETGNLSPDAQISLAQFRPEEIQEAAEQQTATGIVENVIADDPSVSSENADLREILKNEDHPFGTSGEIDLDNVPDADDLAALLEQTNLN